MPRRDTPAPPPFCPNPICDSRNNSKPWRFKKKGFFHRDQNPRRVQRYLCHHCGRNFSAQTFSTTYWLRRGDLLEPLFLRLLSCSALRQIAREFKVSHSTLQRQSEHLGRHCLLFQERLRPKQAPREPLVLDGFRTFEHSQYWPMDLNLLVGMSHYVYGFNAAELRRSGAMRPAQRLKRESLEEKYGRPDPLATRKHVEELLRRIVPPGAKAVVRSDEHPAYPQAMRRLRDRTFHHETTSSKVSRTTQNPLFPVNLADLLLRHCSANHKRETIAFSKRRQGALYRMAIWVVWRNYIKSRSENRRDAPPAKELGIIRQALGVADVLKQRMFPDRASTAGWVRKCYFGRISTRVIANCRVHQAKYAQ
jgi:transposase-like protein